MNNIDSVSFQNNALIALNFTGTSSSHSVSTLMANAVTAEKNAQTLQNTGVTQCCALMISVGAAGAAS